MAERRKIDLFPKPPMVGSPELPEDPQSWEASVMDFLSGALGDQKPGELDSALGAILGLIPIGKGMKLTGGKKPSGDSLLRKHELPRGPFGADPDVPRAIPMAGDVPPEFHAIEMPEPPVARPTPKRPKSPLKGDERGEVGLSISPNPRNEITLRKEFDEAVDQGNQLPLGTKRGNRRVVENRVNDRYQDLVDADLAAPKEELAKLAGNVNKMKQSSPKPRPMGNVGQSLEWTDTIIKKIATQTGYKPTPEDFRYIFNEVSTLTQEAKPAARGMAARGLGDVVSYLKASPATPRNLAKAISMVPGGWAQGALMGTKRGRGH